MTDRPIIFSASMVRALLDGRKTQTRRILRGVPPQPGDDRIVREPTHEHAYFDSYCGGKKTAGNPRGMTEDWCWWTRDDRCGHGCKVRFVPGDRAYVRESWRVSPEACKGWHPEEMRGWIDYQAGGSLELIAPSFEAVEKAAFLKGEDRDWDFLPSRYRPCIHMPRWASRITLTITDVRVERVQAIAEADALAEGTQEPSLRALSADLAPAAWSERQVYQRLWDSLHTKDGDRWADNPWCYALTFSVGRGNIDQVLA